MNAHAAAAAAAQVPITVMEPRRGSPAPAVADGGLRGSACRIFRQPARPAVESSLKWWGSGVDKFLDFGALRRVIVAPDSLEGGHCTVQLRSAPEHGLSADVSLTQARGACGAVPGRGKTRPPKSRAADGGGAHDPAVGLRPSNADPGTEEPPERADQRRHSRESWPSFHYFSVRRMAV